MEKGLQISPLQHIRGYLSDHDGAKIGVTRLDTVDPSDHLHPGSSFYQLAPAQQQQLTKFVTSLTQRIDRDREEKIFNDPQTTAEALDEASQDVLRLIASGWTGKTAVYLSVRHESSSLQDLIDEFSVHPMLSTERCREFIIHSSNNPRRRLAAVVAYFQSARTEHGIWQLSNDIIFKTVGFQDMLAGNFAPLIEAEEAAYQPLSLDAAEALDQLRDNRSAAMAAGRIHKDTVATITQSIDRSLNSDPSLVAQCTRLGIASDDLQGFSKTVAGYAEVFDYAALNTEQLQEIAKQYIQQAEAIQKLDIPLPLALKAALSHGPDYYVDFMNKSRSADIAPGAVRALLKNFTSDPTFYLNKLVKLSDEMEQIDPEMSKKARLIIAQKLMGSGKPAQEIIDDHYSNIQTAHLLFGKRLSEGYIRRVCITQPLSALAAIGNAHKLAEELYEAFYEPCMPEGFIQALVEKTSHKTIRDRLEAYKKEIASIRNQYADYGDGDVWNLVQQRLKA